METELHSEALERAMALEREAHSFRSGQKIEEAFNAFDEAASIYRDAGEHFKAALCFSSAATCWNIRTGWQPLRNAATRNESAAHEAMRASHYEYARSHFLEAALLYEKEGDSGKYSACFYNSKIADRMLSWHLFAHGEKDEGAGLLAGQTRWKERLLAFFRWFVNALNYVTWGYGERPLRTFFVACCIIIGTASFYAVSGQILVEGVVRHVSFFEALYLSIITYSTVGFGDYLPVGWTRILAAHEALAGIFLTPLFLIALTRRYLRMDR